MALTRDAVVCQILPRVMTILAAKMPADSLPPASEQVGYPSFGMPLCEGFLWSLKAEWLHTTLTIVIKAGEGQYFRQTAYAFCQAWFRVLVAQWHSQDWDTPTDAMAYYWMFGMSAPAMPHCWMFATSALAMLYYCVAAPAMHYC